MYKNRIIREYVIGREGGEKKEEELESDVDDEDVWRRKGVNK